MWYPPDMYDYMCRRRFVPGEVPRCGEVMVRRVIVPSVFGLRRRCQHHFVSIGKKSKPYFEVLVAHTMHVAPRRDVLHTQFSDMDAPGVCNDNSETPPSKPHPAARSL